MQRPARVDDVHGDADRDGHRRPLEGRDPASEAVGEALRAAEGRTAVARVWECAVEDLKLEGIHTPVCGPHTAVSMAARESLEPWTLETPLRCVSPTRTAPTDCTPSRLRVLDYILQSSVTSVSTPLARTTNLCTTNFRVPAVG